MASVTDLEAAHSFWDAEARRSTHTSWLEHAPFSLYALRQIDPVNAEWPVDWFQIWLRGRRFKRGLSIGCGAGAFERDIIHHGLCDRIDAFDASLAALAVARREADRCGFGSRIHYYAADFNDVRLPRNAFDVVFFHQSLHHVAKLERLLCEVLMTLHPRGLVYLDEYIGPSRADWSDQAIAYHRKIFDSLPPEVKTGARLELPIQQDDPSEAVRSGEIVPLLRVGFRTAAFRGYGGNLLSVLYPNLNPSALSKDLSESLIEYDRRLVQQSRRSYYAVIVVRPRRGLRRWLARRRYSALARIDGPASQLRRSIVIH